jgi:hypothetical protein
VLGRGAGADCESALLFEFPGTITGSTTGAGNEHQPEGCLDPGQAHQAPELVYEVKIVEGGDFYEFNVIDADFGTVIYLRDTCEDQSSEIACDASEISMLQLDQSRTYYLFVDGLTTESGSFELQAMYSEY